MPKNSGVPSEPRDVRPIPRSRLRAGTNHKVSSSATVPPFSAVKRAQCRRLEILAYSSQDPRGQPQDRERGDSGRRTRGARQTELRGLTEISNDHAAHPPVAPGVQELTEVGESAHAEDRDEDGSLRARKSADEPGLHEKRYWTHKGDAW